MKSNTRKVELASVDYLFSIEKSRQDAVREKKMDIPITKLYKETFDLFAQKTMILMIK